MDKKIVGFALALSFILISNNVSANPSDAWYNSDWPYRKEINISNTAGALTDFQVNINITNDDFTGENFNWSSDGADIRITDSSGSLLDIWIPTNEWITDISSFTELASYNHMTNFGCGGHPYGFVHNSSYLYIYHMHEVPGGGSNNYDIQWLEYNIDTDTVDRNGTTFSIGATIKIDNPEVIRVGDTYYMFYNEHDSSRASSEYNYLQLRNSTDGKTFDNLTSTDFLGLPSCEYMLGDPINISDTEIWYYTNNKDCITTTWQEFRVIYYTNNNTILDREWLFNTSDQLLWSHIINNGSNYILYYSIYNDGVYAVDLGSDGTTVGTPSEVISGLHEFKPRTFTVNGSDYMTIFDEDKNIKIYEKGSNDFIYTFLQTIDDDGSNANPITYNDTTVFIPFSKSRDTNESIEIVELEVSIGSDSLATIWTKVPSLADAANTTIYLYYGNDGASSVSDIYKTAAHNIGDEFTGASLNTTIWSLDQGGVTFDNGRLVLTGDASTPGLISSTTNYTYPKTVYSRIQAASDTPGKFHSGIKVQGTSFDYIGSDWAGTDAAADRIVYWTFGSSGNYSTNTLVHPGDITEYNIYRNTWEQQNSTGYINGNLEIYHTATVPIVNQSTFFRESQTNGVITYVDWVFTTEYANPTPSIILYSEETETTPPNIDFVSPTTSNATLSENVTYIVWNISVSENIGSCEIQINGTNQTGTQSDSGSTSYCYYNETGLITNQTRCAFGHASDSVANWNTTLDYICINTDIQYNISGGDSTPPNLDFVSPTLSNTTITANDWIYVNVSADESLDTCYLEWNNGSWTNVTMTVTGSYCYANQTGLSDGTYYFRVYGNDTAGNLNTTDDREITADLTGPAISVSSPSNALYSSQIDLNVTSSDVTSTISSCLYNLDGGANTTLYNSSETVWFQTIASATDGSHQLNVYCNDSVNNWNLDNSITFSFDTTPPAGGGGGWFPEPDFDDGDMNYTIPELPDIKDIRSLIGGLFGGLPIDLDENISIFGYMISFWLILAIGIAAVVIIIIIIIGVSRKLF